MLTIRVWQWPQYIVLKWCSETADWYSVPSTAEHLQCSFLYVNYVIYDLSKKNFEWLHFVSVSLGKCWQAGVFWSLMYYWKVGNSDPAVSYLGFGRIRIHPGSWDVGSGCIWIRTGSTKSTGCPAGSGSGFGSPLKWICHSVIKDHDVSDYRKWWSDVYAMHVVLYIVQVCKVGLVQRLKSSFIARTVYFCLSHSLANLVLTCALHPKLTGNLMFDFLLAKTELITFSLALAAESIWVEIRNLSESRVFKGMDHWICFGQNF